MGLRQMLLLEDVLAVPEAPDLAPLLLRHEARSLRDIRTLLAPLATCMEACANPGAPAARDWHACLVSVPAVHMAFKCVLWTTLMRNPSFV